MSPLTISSFCRTLLNRPFTFLKDNACTVAHALLLKWIRSTIYKANRRRLCLCMVKQQPPERNAFFSSKSSGIYIRPSAFLYIFYLWITQTRRGSENRWQKNCPSYTYKYIYVYPKNKTKTFASTEDIRNCTKLFLIKYLLFRLIKLP